MTACCPNSARLPCSVTVRRSRPEKRVLALEAPPLQMSGPEPRSAEVQVVRRNLGRMPRDHPVAVLRGLLGRDFDEDLPNGVSPVSQWCADPQFFPGATGLSSETSWQDVSPGSAGVAETLPPSPEHGLVVVGNYQATVHSYQRILARDLGGFPTTWRALRQLLASVSPQEVFLTKAFVGLPVRAGDTEPFPTTPSFTRRCERRWMPTASR